MNTWDVIPVLLLILLGVTIGTGGLLVLLALRWRSRSSMALGKRADYRSQFQTRFTILRAVTVRRPSSWLAVRSRSPRAVQSALELDDPESCGWVEGLAGEQELFIAPPVDGWILVVGPALPQPAEDVDECFRFLLELSRKLGRVQFFTADHFLHHHTWARVEAGRVVRAYAWTGETVWNQGVRTRGERELGLTCYQYLETPERTLPGYRDVAVANTAKVPLLAARWSLDPGAVDERQVERACGIAGRLPRLH